MSRPRPSGYSAATISPRVIVGIALLTVLGGCADHKRTGSADSDLSRDLQLAGQIAAQPTFQDTALSSSAAPARQTAPERTPTPTRRVAHREEQRRSPVPQPMDVRPNTPVATAPMPAPAPAPAAAPARQIGAGTSIVMTSGGRVCTEDNRPGDKIVATIDSPVSGTNGALIPAGSKVVLEIASVTPGDQGNIQFRVRSIFVNDSSYSVAGTVTPTTPLERVKVANSDPNADKKKVIGGALAGAILGQIIGHNTKGTLIGAATGAAAGAVAAKASEKYEACLPAGASLHMTLAQAVAM
jgi:YmgG-like glycine-zipper protein